MSTKDYGMGVCEVCGKPFVKKTGIAKYCSMPCKRKMESQQNREWLQRFRRQLKEERERMKADYKPYKPNKSIAEVVEEANAAGLSYGKYVALMKEGEMLGRCEVDQDHN